MAAAEAMPNNAENPELVAASEMGAGDDIPVMEVQAQGDEDLWKSFAEPTPMPALIWGWSAVSIMLILQTIMVNEYCSKSKHMKIGDIPVWCVCMPRPIHPRCSTSPRRRRRTCAYRGQL